MSNNNWQEEAMRRLRQMQQARGGAGGGGPKMPMPRAAGGALFAGLLVAGGTLVLSNSLFNVDGGHRAIKYQRLTGVSKEIYNEGTRTWDFGVFGLEANVGKQEHISTFLGSRLRLCTMSERSRVTLRP
jgi:prohibitin 2